MNITHRKDFNNFTDMPDSEAKELVSRFRDTVNQAERDLSERVDVGKRMMELYKNIVWDASDMAFFDSFDATPIEFSVARPLINNLISKQRKRRFSYEFVPLDNFSYDRHIKTQEEFIQKNADLFDNREEAEEFFHNYGDDKYAEMITGLLTKFKSLSGGKWSESESFEGGAITGADFLKADMDVYGRPQWSRRSLNRMVWDTNAIEYDLSDAEYIGDKVRWYKSDIKSKFPEIGDQVEELFERYTRLRNNNKFEPNKRWEAWWNFDNTDSMQLKVMDMYYKTTEPRFLIIDEETGDETYAKHDQEEDEIYDSLAIKMVRELTEDMGEEAMKELSREDAKERVLAMVEERYTIEKTFREVWYEMVFSYNTLFLHQRTTHPKGKHPFTAFFPVHNDGNFSGFLEDIEDIVIALNKALAIRELMMSHSAKGLVVVDEQALDDSNLTPDDVADEYTKIGGLLVMKLKYNRTIDDVMKQINTVGEGIPAINNIIADYDQRLFRISGVNLAQLGVTQSETPTSRYKMQLQEGESTNGLIFDNFVRTLESFYSEHVIPMSVRYAKENPRAVGRLIGQRLAKWTKVEVDRDFNLFESAINSGEFAFSMQPRSEDPTLENELNAKMMEMAVGGLIPLELAFEYSNSPDRFEIIKKIKLFRRQQMLEQLQNKVDYEKIVEIVLNEEGVDAKTADSLIKKTRLQAEQQKKQKQNPSTSGLEQIKQSASQTKKAQNIDKATSQNALRTSQQPSTNPK
ncbi:hypothetical protein ACKGJO_06600 [Gracilimonas sp. Q87]|uniref:portal protein n=1 Tax=Gracilimonas sp. Q87 TaxID=3384766 RepID=UPI00398431E5